MTVAGIADEVGGGPGETAVGRAQDPDAGDPIDRRSPFALADDDQGRVRRMNGDAADGHRRELIPAGLPGDSAVAAPPETAPALPTQSTFASTGSNASASARPALFEGPSEVQLAAIVSAAPASATKTARRTARIRGGTRRASRGIAPVR